MMSEDRLVLLDQDIKNDLVRDMLALAAGCIMEMEVEARTRAASGARSDNRNTRTGRVPRADHARKGPGGWISISRSCARDPALGLSLNRDGLPRRR